MGGEKLFSILGSGNLIKASNEGYTISEAMAIIQCKGYGKIMLRYPPIHIQQILFVIVMKIGGFTKIFSAWIFSP